MSFFCKNCGTQLEDGTQFCTNCGAQTTPAYQQPQQAYQQPSYQQQPYQQPVYQQQYYQQPEPPKSSGIAICAFIFAFIFAPVGLILGIIGLAKKNAGSKGLSVAAVVISGVISLIGVVSVAILMPATLGYVNRARQAASDSTAKRIKTEVTSVMTDAEKGGYGIRSGKVQEFDIIVSDGKWTVSAADPSNFGSSNTMTWGSEASGKYTDVILMNLNTGEKMLLANISGSNPDITDGLIHFAVYNNACTACVYCPEKTGSLFEGIDYPDIGDNGEFGDVSDWKKHRSVKNIGLAPAVG